VGNFAYLGRYQTFIDELRDFPFGRKDNQVDALVRAFTTLSARSHPAKIIAIPIFNR